MLNNLLIRHKAFIGGVALGGVPQIPFGSPKMPPEAEKNWRVITKLLGLKS